MKRTIAAVVFAACSLVSSASGQSIPQASPKEVWDTLANPVMDPDHSAPVQNVQIKRDRVTITLSDGVIQFAKPANGLVFGATFHGNGRVQMDPPNSVEEHQLLLFTKQSKLDLSFNEATFSFTDDFFDEVAALVKWDSSSLTSGELYAARKKSVNILVRDICHNSSKACSPPTAAELLCLSRTCIPRKETGSKSSRMPLNTRNSSLVAGSSPTTADASMSGPNSR